MQTDVPTVIGGPGVGAPRHQAKEVICSILAASGGELHKKATLSQAFYHAHLFYWQEQGEALTDHPIVRMLQGPGIGDHGALLAELEAEGRIQIRRASFGPYPEYVYALRQPFLVELNDPRYRAVEKAVNWVEGKTAAELSRETHEYSRSWQMGHDGDELNIYIDLMDDEEYAAMRRRLEKSEAILGEAFAEVG